MPLISIITNVIALSPSCENAIVKCITKFKAKKGSLLTVWGDINQHIFYVEHGLLRSFRLDSHVSNDQEITTLFAGEGEIIFPVNSFLRKLPAEEYIEVIEDTILQRISYSDILELTYKFPELSNLDSILLEHCIERQQFQIEVLSTKDPLKRYALFLKRFPKLATRLPLKHIATYLCVSYSYLSRLRKNVK